MAATPYLPLCNTNGNAQVTIHLAANHARQWGLAFITTLSVMLTGCMSSSGGCLQDGRTIQVSTNDIVSTRYVETGRTTAEVKVGESVVLVSANSISVDNRAYPLDPQVKAINIERSHGMIAIYGDGQLLLKQ
ncbi:MAG: hypothetical protein QM703_24640 [Gemmatales bacterium]